MSAQPPGPGGHSGGNAGGGGKTGAGMGSKCSATWFNYKNIFVKPTLRKKFAKS